MKSLMKIEKPFAAFVVMLLVLCSVGTMFVYETDDVSADDIFDDEAGVESPETSVVDAKLIDSILAELLSYSALLPYYEPSADSATLEGTQSIADKRTFDGDLILSDGATLLFAPGATLSAERIFIQGDVQFKFDETSEHAEGASFYIVTKEVLVQNLSLTENLLETDQYFTITSDGAVLVTSDSKNLSRFFAGEVPTEDPSLSFFMKLFAYGSSFTLECKSEKLEHSISLPPSGTEPVMELSLSFDLTSFRDSLVTSLTGITYEELFSKLAKYVDDNLVLPPVSIGVSLPAMSESYSMRHDKYLRYSLEYIVAECKHTYTNTIEDLSVSLTTDPTKESISLSASVGKFRFESTEQVQNEVEQDLMVVEGYSSSISYDSEKCQLATSSKILSESTLDGSLSADEPDKYVDYDNEIISYEDLSETMVAKGANLLKLVDLYESSENSAEFVQKVCESGLLADASGEITLGSYSEETTYTKDYEVVYLFNDNAEELKDVRIVFDTSLATGATVEASLGENASSESYTYLSSEDDEGYAMESRSEYSTSIKNLSLSLNAETDDLLRIISTVAYALANDEDLFSDDLLAAVLTASFSNNGVYLSVSLGSLSDSKADSTTETYGTEVTTRSIDNSSTSFAANKGPAVELALTLNTSLGMNGNLRAILSPVVMFGNGAAITHDEYTSYYGGDDVVFSGGEDIDVNLIDASVTDLIVDAPYSELAKELESSISAITATLVANISYADWDFDSGEDFDETGNGFVQGMLTVLDRANIKLPFDVFSNDDSSDSSTGISVSADRLAISGYKTDKTDAGYRTFSALVQASDRSFEVSGSEPKFVYTDTFATDLTEITFGSAAVSENGSSSNYPAISESQAIGYLVSDNSYSWYSSVAPVDDPDCFALTVRAYAVDFDDTDSKVTISADSDEIQVTDEIISKLVGGLDSTDKNIVIETDTGSNGSTVIISASSLETIDEADSSVSINAVGGISVTLDSNVVSTLASTEGGNATVSLKTLSASDLAAAGLSADMTSRLGKMTVISVDLTVGTQVIHNLNGTATVTMPFDKADDEEVVIFYLNTETNSLERIEGVTYSNGYVSFTTDHFSMYAVSTEESGSEDENSMLYVLVVAAILLVLIFAFFLLRNKKKAA